MMTEKKTHGGKRKGSGAKTKPKEKHKKNIAVYFEQEYIDKLGGEKRLKNKIRRFVYGLLGVPYKGNI